MNKIVVGIDGSETSRRALEWALDEARLRDATVEVVHAWHYPYVVSMPAVAPVVERDVLEEAAKEVVEDILAGVDTSGVTVERRVMAATAATALVEASDDADLVVVGSRGRGGFAGLVLGSVSHQVVSHAMCPVVVVRAID